MTSATYSSLRNDAIKAVRQSINLWQRATVERRPFISQVALPDPAGSELQLPLRKAVDGPGSRGAKMQTAQAGRAGSANSCLLVCHVTLYGRDSSDHLKSAVKGWVALQFCRPGFLLIQEWIESSVVQITSYKLGLGRQAGKTSDLIIKARKSCSRLSAWSSVEIAFIQRTSISSFP
jgi:hypothetical protein